MSKSLTEMSGPELVNEYNRLAAPKKLPTVKRFSDRKSALRRIGALSAQPKAPAPEVSKIASEFGVRKGTNRQVLIDRLYEDKGKQVPRSELLKALYGSSDKKYNGALNMVLNGLLALIKKKRLRYEIVKERKEASCGLYSA